MNRLAVLVLLAAWVAPSGAMGATEAQDKTAERRWDFRVALDGEPIGEHHFRIRADGDRRTLVSEAAFTVRFLGVPVYRFRHEATEQWRGDCLSALSSTTDNDGQPSSVQFPQKHAADRLSTPSAEESGQGCIMSYAYWNPSIRTKNRLLNAQTGRLDAVHIEPAGSGTVDVSGRPLAAVRWRISGNAHPLDVWYSPQGEWIGLDTTVGSGRRLTYRLP